MTPHNALAVIGVMSLFVLVTTTVIRAVARIADERRAYHATHFLVGRAYWSPDMVIDPMSAGWLSYQPAPCLPPAAGSRSVTRCLPRVRIPSGASIDVATPGGRS